MRKFKITMVIVIFLSAFVSVFVCYNCVAKGVTKGLYLCADVIIPTLFPTLCITSFLTESGIITAFAGRLENISKRLFNLSGYFIPVFLLSMVSGYPVGAAMSSSLYNSGFISIDERNKIAVVSCFAGPSFVLLAVGVGMLGSKDIGIVLLISHLLAGISSAVIITRFFKYTPLSLKYCKTKIIIGDSIVNGVAAACSSVISICAYTVLFSAVVNVISLGLRGTAFYLPAVSMLEVTNAVYALSNESVPLCVISAAVGFGGFSVIFQLSSVLGDDRPPISEFIVARLINAGLSFVYCNIILVFFDITVPVVKTEQTYASISSKNMLFSLSLVLLLVVFLCSIRKKENKSVFKYL